MALIQKLLFLITITKVIAQNCSFSTSNANSPIVLNEDFTFPSSLEYDFEELFYIFCPKGTSNPLISESGDRAVCKGGTTLLNIGTVQILQYEEIICHPLPATTVRKSNETCENNGTIIEIGFEVLQNFVPEVSVCFDEKKLAPFYSIYRRPEKNLVWNTRDPYEAVICGNESRPCLFIDSADTYQNLNIDLVYKDQAQILENLGVDVGDNFLVKLPLASGAFFNKMSQEQQAYPYWDYANVVPMWHRRFYPWSNFYNNILMELPEFVFAGTLGVASIDGIELYLSDGKVPVPKWTWIIYKRYEKVLFVFNALSNVIQEADELCTDPSVSTLQSTVSCKFEAIIVPELKEVIKNHFQ